MNPVSDTDAFKFSTESALGKATNMHSHVVERMDGSTFSDFFHVRDREAAAAHHPLHRTLRLCHVRWRDIKSMLGFRASFVPNCLALMGAVLLRGWRWQRQNAGQASCGDGARCRRCVRCGSWLVEGCSDGSKGIEV